MKELSIEEKARNYDEAYKKVAIRFGSNVADEIFPELKESKDEQMRKGIIRNLEYLMDRAEGFVKDELKERIAWLEKQGEKNLADKIEPKFNFKVGQWIVATGKQVYLITKIDGFNVTLVDTNGNEYVFDASSLDDAYQWSIADAKPSDVLVYKDEISIYKHDIKNCTKQEPTFGGFVYHCCYDGKRFITDSLYSLTEQDKIDIHPATKGQRDTLERAITNAGYRWNKEKLKLKKI